MKKIKYVMPLAFLLAGISLSMLSSCKNNANTEGTKDLEVEYLKIWGKDVDLQKNEVAVKGSSKYHTLEVQLKGVQAFSLEATNNNDGNKLKNDSNAGIATIPGLPIPLDESTWTITLTADGYKPKNLLVKVTRTDDQGSFTTKLKRNEDGKPINVADKAKLETAGSKVKVSVESAYVMKKVTIAGESVSLSDDKKSTDQLEVNVSSADVSVEVEFEYYKKKSESFTLKKVTGEISLAATKATIYSGNEGGTSTEVVFGEDKKFSCQLGDIEYSLVKLEMEFDANLTSKAVTCRDERSAQYSTNPLEGDSRGVFSGYVITELVPGKGREPLTPIKGNVYTEYLIVGAGKVTYEIKFEAPGRKATTYTIEITNTVTEKFKVSTNAQGHLAPPVLGAVDYFGFSPALANSNNIPYLPLRGYHKGPLYRIHAKNGIEMIPENYKEMLAMDSPILRYFLETTTAQYEESGHMVLYFNNYEENKNKHEFFKLESKLDPSAKGNKAEVINVQIDVKDKYLDCFLAFKNKLPQGIHPYSTSKKWESVENGVIAALFETAGGDKATFASFTWDAYDYPHQYAFIKKAQANNSNEMLTISKNTKWKSWLLGAEHDTTKEEGEEGKKFKPAVLQNNMFLALFLTGGEGYTAKYTIEKSIDNGSNFTEVSGYKDKETSILFLRGLPSVIIGMPVVNPNEDIDLGGVYKFAEKEGSSTCIYKVTLNLTNKADNKANKYVYKLDFGSTSTDLTTSSVDTFPSYTEDFFGVPTSYDSVMDTTTCTFESVNRFVDDVVKF